MTCCHPKLPVEHTGFDDGAKGLKNNMRTNTVGQAEDGCVAGMQEEAAKPGAVNRELPLDRIAYEIVAYRGGRQWST